MHQRPCQFQNQTQTKVIKYESVISKTLKKKIGSIILALIPQNGEAGRASPGWWEEGVRCGEGEEPAQIEPKNHPLRRLSFLGRQP